ncbi:branched-chain amino acid aminotransferase [Acetobacteraceae bacterium KSS8]|uniref:Branched-chain-amino-acid aminotransferase n=1 Tax=Endosaccharibacter trunci TaxID=2812733 RepID=A0ABT1WBA1_9PROT|nr:branched-chain amino acid aminotransferase [Acetobacteraceae bacterium KSS8]
MQFDVKPSTNPVPEAERTALIAQPSFGSVFTDHMVMIRHTAEGGWQTPLLTARAPIPMDPASSVLHYAQEIFEGMKAYRIADGSTVLFRPEANAARFRQSAARMAMPDLPPELFVRGVEELVRQDRAWIPTMPGGSLYLRPFMIATEAFLGVRPAREHLFMVIASPVGAYFSGKTEAVTLWVSQTYTRAARGGTGAAKCGGNYAAGLLAQAEATRNECQQVVFLDAAEGRWIEELGGMNVFFVRRDGSLITPPLGTILPGITRDSIMTLARDMGMSVTEQPYAFEQWRADAEGGEVVEAFACGTAATVAPIGRVKFEGGSFEMQSGATAGLVTETLRRALFDIQFGRVADQRGWVHRV